MDERDVLRVTLGVFMKCTNFLRILVDFWGLRFRARFDDMSPGGAEALKGRAIHIKPRHVFYCSMSGAVSQKLARFPFALDWVELALAEAERLRSDFEKFVVKEEVNTLLKGVLGVRGELDGAVGGMGAHVG